MNNWFLEMDFSTVLIAVSGIIFLILQLTLCFKAKRVISKLLPAVFLLASTIVFFVFSAVINGWEGMDYLFFAFLSLGLIFVCGIGWCIWTMVKK